jgi:hypothetical protein
MLNKEGVSYKRGQVYVDESGKNWVYWGTVREWIGYDKGPHSKTNSSVGKFYEMGHVPKGYYSPHHETISRHLCYDNVGFVANSVKDLQLINSGVDIKLINLLIKAIKDIKCLPTSQDEEWSYDAVVYWMHGLERFVTCLAELKPGEINSVSGHHQLNSVLEPRLRNADITAHLEEPIKNANEQTIVELKKLAKIIEKERIKVLTNQSVKRKYVEGYIEKYYDDPEKEFLNSLISWNMINDMDLTTYSLGISNVNVKVDVSESCSGSIQYWSHRNVGSASINGIVHSGDFYSNKSHGWNWND